LVVKQHLGNTGLVRTESVEPCLGLASVNVSRDSSLENDVLGRSVVLDMGSHIYLLTSDDERRVVDRSYLVLYPHGGVLGGVQTLGFGIAMGQMRHVVMVQVVKGTAVHRFRPLGFIYMVGCGSMVLGETVVEGSSHEDLGGSSGLGSMRHYFILYELRFLPN
jgi:hypothetical protein